MPVVRVGTTGYRVSLMPSDDKGALRLVGRFFLPPPSGTIAMTAPERRHVPVPRHLKSPRVPINRPNHEKGRLDDDKSCLSKDGWALLCDSWTDPNLYLVWNGRSITYRTQFGKTMTATRLCL